MALPYKVIERDARDPNSVLHRLTTAYIPEDGVVGIFRAHHYPTTPWHIHDFFELAIIECGTALHVSDRGVEPVAGGTVLFVPPGIGHEYRLCDNVVVYNCLFRASLAEAELMWAFRDDHLSVLFDPAHRSRGRRSDPITITHLNEPEVATVIGALEPIRTESPQARTRAAQLAHLLLALDAVATAVRKAGDAAEPTKLPPPVAAAVTLIEEDLAFPWTLAELSRRAYVGPAHLNRSFARSLGMPPIHYLSRIRAERAAAMLARTDDPVAAIGAAVGWPDPAYFSRRFRAALGVSPREYRHRHQRAIAAGTPGPRPVET